MRATKPPTAALPHWRLTRLRRRVFWLFVAAYAAFMPVLILFAFGISYSKGKAPVPTSSFTVSTIPSGARVTLQGQRAQMSPALFDSLKAGRYAFSISAEGARTWTGMVESRPELVSTIADLKMISQLPPHKILSFTARGVPLWVEEDAEAAWLPRGESSLATTRLAGTSEVNDRVSLPGLSGVFDPTLQWLQLTGQLLLSWREQDSGYVRLMQNGRNSPLLRNPGPALRVPSSALELVSLSEDEKTLTAIDMAGVGRYNQAGQRTSLVKLSAPLFAYGYARGRWYLLDRDGTLSQYGNPLGFGEIHHVDLRRYEQSGSSPVMRILAVTSEAIVCHLASESTVHVLTAERSIIYEGYEGGSAQKSGEGAWVWSGNGLSSTRRLEQPVEEAQFPDRVSGVSEEFWPRITAVRTASSLYLIPKPLSSGGVHFAPLLLFQDSQQVQLLGCANGMLLLRDDGAIDGPAYDIMGWQQ
ncbi:MAG: PEGA domain-containing protein [Spirochaetia bacterium]|jgi:hypothetical protein